MLYAFGFDRLAVLAGDLYFQHPNPPLGQEGPERGVRLELRRIKAEELRGSVYSARPISVEQAIWRVDLLETVDREPGSFDRTHYHPTFQGWDESARRFDEELSADPLAWLEKKLLDLPGVLSEAGVPADTAGPDDLTGIRLATPEILDATRRLLARVRAGELNRPPEVPVPGLVRSSWL
ncbi:hypothetical protein ABZW03_38845 [Kitasatospora sp. NPDC004799]|uniref:hypothetical protein n=1 Tax=Kitasatospora sp. NPDC004799 TaxID=3154460 RepID=UPI0033B8686F